MKKKSLLSKTLSLFVVCTTVIFILTTPLFYLLTKHFYAEDMADIINAVQQGNGIPSLDLERDIIMGMMLQLLLIFIVLCFALLLTIRFMTHRLWSPFDDTLKMIEQFNLAKNPIPQLYDGGIEEFARLNDSLRKLIQKDKEAYRIQKEFTENASHELQTPLAIIRSKLDLLMQENADEKTMLAIADLYSLNIRMEHLNRNLLLLAKIENEQYTEMEDIDLNDFIESSLPGYEALHSGICFEHDKKDIFKIRANRILLECLLNNLIVNAIRHTPDTDGGIKVLSSNGNLTVYNSAYGDSLKADTLFLRFRTGDVNKKGNGLGLSIVKAICDYHGWDVNYSFEDKGHKFSILFII